MSSLRNLIGDAAEVRAKGPVWLDNEAPADLRQWAAQFASPNEALFACERPDWIVHIASRIQFRVVSRLRLYGRVRSRSTLELAGFHSVKPSPNRAKQLLTARRRLHALTARW